MVCVGTQCVPSVATCVVAKIYLQCVCVRYRQDPFFSIFLRIERYISSRRDVQTGSLRAPAAAGARAPAGPNLFVCVTVSRYLASS